MKLKPYWTKGRNGKRKLNGILERCGDTSKNGMWFYVHWLKCDGGCEYSCNTLHPYNVKHGFARP